MVIYQVHILRLDRKEVDKAAKMQVAYSKRPQSCVLSVYANMPTLFQEAEGDQGRRAAAMGVMSRHTSGVKMDSGTSMQKKPRDTQCVANLRMPK